MSVIYLAQFVLHQIRAAHKKGPPSGRGGHPKWTDANGGGPPGGDQPTWTKIKRGGGSAKVKNVDKSQKMTTFLDMYYAQPLIIFYLFNKRN